MSHRAARWRRSKRPSAACRKRSKNRATAEPRDAILRPMEELVAELRQSLAEIDPRMTIKGLESEVSKLGIKIDDLGRTSVDPAAFGHIQAQTREIRDLLSAAIARPLPVERIERQVAELAQSLGEQRAAPPRENFANVPRHGSRRNFPPLKRGLSRSRRRSRNR